MSAWHDSHQALVPQQVGGQVVPFDVGLLDPGNGQVEAAFSHPRRLRVRGKDPFVDADAEVGNCCCLCGKPTDIAEPQR